MWGVSDPTPGPNRWGPNILAIRSDNPRQYLSVQDKWELTIPYTFIIRTKILSTCWMLNVFGCSVLRFKIWGFAFFFSFLFFFFLQAFQLLPDKCTVEHYWVLFIYCLYTVHETYNHYIQKIKIKMSFTILFIHLKIILLPYFQFQ